MIRIAVPVKFYNGEISLFDQSALACALSVSDGDVTILSMSPLCDKDRLRFFTRYGIRATLISDNLFSGSDTLATAKILSAYLRDKFDLIICGKQSFNGDTAQVPAEISSLLGVNFYPYVLGFSLDTVDTRLGRYKVELPCVMSVERINVLCPPSIFSRESECTVIDNGVLKVNVDEIGLQNSETKVLATFEREKVDRKCRFIDRDGFYKILDEYKDKEIKTQFTINKKFNKVYFVGREVSEIADSISEESTEIGGTVDEIVKRIEKEQPNIVIFPATLKYRAIAPIISARLNCGLCADCIKLENDNERLVMYRPSLGGNTIAKIISKSYVQMATVRVAEKSSNIVFGIGYGAKDYIKEIENLAKEYGAEVVCSRKVVDSDLLPYNNQVGLTGKKISPSLYVAFGVGGAVQHLVGVDANTTIIAVNNNKNEEIFNRADYGYNVDIKDFFG